MYFMSFHVDSREGTRRAGMLASPATYAASSIHNEHKAVGLLPVTGQNLPLISRGGTSIVCTSIYIGMMLSVSRYAQKTKKKNKAAIASEENDEEIEE